MKARPIEKRADLRNADDAKFAMVHARRRFAKERASHVGAARGGFRAWAKKTYGQQAVRGKLREIVSAP